MLSRAASLPIPLDGALEQLILIFPSLDAGYGAFELEEKDFPFPRSVGWMQGLAWLACLVASACACGIGEWRCLEGGVRCVPPPAFCDGVPHCDDASDEPPDCTNCNRTLSGGGGPRRALRVSGPGRFVPLSCRISFLAEEPASFVELAFLSFHVGALATDGEGCEGGSVRLWEPGEGAQWGRFCGPMTERSATFFSQGPALHLEAQVPARASAPFSLYLTYRFLRRSAVRPPGSLGHRSPGSSCDRVFGDCGRGCLLRTPNFPGFYPRNVTCNLLVRHLAAPQGYRAKVVLSQPNEYKVWIPTGRRPEAPGARQQLASECAGGDSVSVFDGASPEAPRILLFCGAGPLPPLVASGNQVLLQVRSAAFLQPAAARLEVEAGVRLEPASEEPGCALQLRASRRRWGLLRSPRHSMAEGADCSYRLLGERPHDRVWLYFTSFSSSACGLSRLEVWEGGGEEPAHLFCGERAPRLCAHAADYPPHYLPPRPCEVPGESYLSSGPELELRHRFLSGSAGAGAFVARYEFVDTAQAGAPLPRSECGRRLDSRLGRRGALRSPRNLFLFGRGGRRNLSCAHHFVGLPSERLRVRVLRARLLMGGGACGCRGAPRPGGGWARLRATEFWGGRASELGCACGSALDPGAGDPPLVFEALSSNVRLEFQVVGMSPLHDFEDFFFEAEYEFLDASPCQSGLAARGVPGAGALAFRPPAPRLDPPLRCRWLLEGAPGKHLYLRVRGAQAPAAEACPPGASRLLLFLDSPSEPSATVCAHPQAGAEFAAFSPAWRNGSAAPALAFVEALAAGPFELRWLEVARPGPACPARCRDLGPACIEPGLECDGEAHCPSGEDEAPARCALLPLGYLAPAAGALLACASLAVLCALARRRRPWRKTFC